MFSFAAWGERGLKKKNKNETWDFIFTFSFLLSHQNHLHEAFEKIMILIYLNWATGLRQLEFDLINYNEKMYLIYFDILL